MTEDEVGTFVYELYVRMCRVDVLEMMDPTSRTNKIVNEILDTCDDPLLMAIYRARVPWMATRALGRVIQKQVTITNKESRE